MSEKKLIFAASIYERKNLKLMKHLVLTIVAAALCMTAGAQDRVKTVSANSEKLNIEAIESQAQPVQLNRYLMAGYNTLCLPVSLTKEQVAAAAKNLRVERFVAVATQGSDLNLCFVDCTAEGIEAGVPYLVYSPTAQNLRVRTDDALRTNTALQTVRHSDGKGNQVSFSSSWEMVKQDGRYGIPAKQNVTPLESVLIRTEADKAFLPTRCGFVWEQQAGDARELKIQHFTSLGEVTAVAGVKVIQSLDADAYGLDGQKMGHKKGIAISGGKKVVVR